MRQCILYLCVVFLLGFCTSLSAQQKQDSVYIGKGISGTLDFSLERRKVVQEHDAAGRPLVIVTDRRVADSWVPVSRRQFSYTDDQIESLRIQDWNPGTESFRDRQLRTFIYNPDESLANRLYTRAPAPGAPLENDQRWLYEYDDQNRLLGTRFQRWESGEWINIRQQLYRYQVDGLLEEHLGQRWQNGEWQNERRRLLAYDATHQGLTSVLGQMWSANEASWVNTKRMEYAYTPNGLTTSERTENWDEVAETWVNDNRQLFTRSTQGEFEGRLRQIWAADSWQNQFRGVVAFTNRNLNVLFDAWQTDTEAWQPHSRHQLQYNADDLPTLSQGWQRWNPANSEWVNLLTSRRYRIFWSELVSNVQQPELPSACQLPNPYPLGASISCEGLSPQMPIQVELFDQLGRPILNKTVDYRDQIALNRTLPAGSYVLRIRQGTKLVHLQQLVIAQ